MAAITAQMVAQLRERTGLGMMECKKALTETDGDMDAAIRLLREKGVKDRGARTANEGIVMAHVTDTRRVGVLIELNSETDFVARNEDFKALARQIAAKVAAYGPGTVPTSLEAFLADTFDNGTTVTDTINAATQRIGEKIVLSRFQRFGAPEGNLVTAYVHNPGGSGDEGGKIGVMVEVTGADEAARGDLAREVALHIASANPQYLNESDVEERILETEREIARAQAQNDPKLANKPPQVIEQVVNGRIRKFLEETVLLNQAYVREPSRTVGQIVKESGGASIVRFVRFRVGEMQQDQAGETTPA